MKIKWKQLITAVAIPLLVGGLSYLMTRNSMKSFEILNKPPASPPRLVFPIVWTVLYILMGIASYLVYTGKANSGKTLSALFFYAAQLTFNFFWPVIFFNLEMYLFAFVWLVLMIILIVITTKKFSEISVAAGWLMVPYIIWCIIAAYLNFGVYLLN